MIFGTSKRAEIPDSPAPNFMLTETCSTIAESSVGSTKLSSSLDKRLADIQKSLGENHPAVVEVLTALGDACMRNEDYQESLKYYTQALESTKKNTTPGHPDVADILSCIGLVNYKLSMPKESLSNLKAALDIYSKACSDRSWATEEKDGTEKQIDYKILRRMASTYSAIGSCEFQQKNFINAKYQYENALLEAKKSAIAAASLDPRTSSRSTTSRPSSKSSNLLPKKTFLSQARIHVSEIFNHLASVCTEQNDKATAIQHYNSALALQVQEAGEDSPAVATTLHNIGTMHYRSGEYQLALKSYKQVLKMFRLLYGVEDIRIAHVLVNISTVHEKSFEMERCVSALSAANRLTAKHYGQGSKEYGDTTVQLAAMYARTNCDDLAIENFELALMIYRRAGLDDTHPSVQTVKEYMDAVQGGRVTRVTTNMSDDDKEEQEQLEAIAAWSDVFNSGCGSFCFGADNSIKVVSEPPHLSHSANTPASSFVTV